MLRSVVAVLVIVSLGLASPTISTSAPAGSPGAAGTLDSDFNGDGYQDLAVGIPGWDTVVQGLTQSEVGSVQVWRGSPGGLVRDRRWSKQSRGVLGTPTAGEQWGGQTETADLNNDWFSDLVITSHPGRALSILYGSASGLTATGNQLVAVPGLALGLTTGDFNGDGRGDVAVGSECANGVRCVRVWSGSASGLDPSSEETWSQDTPGIPDMSEPGDGFGDSLASGDFNGDSFDDLAVGSTCEGFGDKACAGQVWTISGSRTGLIARGARIWNQDTPGIKGFAASLEYWSWDLVTADFNNDGFAELAVGGGGSGEINVLFGSATGLRVPGNQLILVGYPYVESLTAGDFDGDGHADLAASCFDCNSGGVVHVWPGSASGVDAGHVAAWTQDTPGIGDAAEAGDSFGWSLTTGNFGKGPEADLAVGVPAEALGGLEAVGIVHAIYGSPTGLTAVGSQILAEKHTQYDLFGSSLNGAADTSK